MNILVLGAAVSGEAAARLARRLGHHVEIYDQRAAALGRLREDAFVVHSGVWVPGHLRNKDLVVTSPGFPEHSAPIVDTLASGQPLVSELEFAAAHLDSRLVAVTGTNGKTTVTGLITDMLVASRFDAVAAGNIGMALSSIVATPHDVVVVEASSFQLRFIDRFSPEVAVIVNVAPDHLDWHGTFEEYAAAKARIFENQGPDGLVVIDGDDPVADRLADSAPGRVLRASGGRVTSDGIGVNGDIIVGEHRFPAGDVGASFLVDLAIAATVAIELGASVAAVAGVIAGFASGPHRRRLVGEWDGVKWVDDSKATNPHAAIASVASFPSVVLIAGGRNKGLDLEPLVTHRAVKSVIAVGEAADEITAVVDAPVAGTISEAVAIADEMATAGDTVLLAPGCASFDMFDSYAARGEAFATAVRSMKEESSWPAA